MLGRPWPEKGLSAIEEKEEEGYLLHDPIQPNDNCMYHLLYLLVKVHSVFMNFV
jgi:hypothetical protein